MLLWDVQRGNSADGLCAHVALCNELNLPLNYPLETEATVEDATKPTKFDKQLSEIIFFFCVWEISRLLKFCHSAIE